MNEVKSEISDWASPPGATIKSLLKKSGLSREDLARHLDLSDVGVSKLLCGSIEIDALMAQDLEKSLGGSASFWLKRDANYRENKIFAADLRPEQWIKTLPVKEMQRWGWISSKTDDISECKKFFGVDTVRDWRIKYQETLSTSHFRRTSGAEEKSGYVLAWLRFQELQAIKTICSPWDPAKFAASLDEIKTLTFIRDPAIFLPRLQAICAASGVALVTARAPKSSTISGAALFLSDDKALIGLSFRHLSDDHVWFTFFHEAGHLLLHGRSTAFVDDDATRMNDTKEAEANRFAADLILPIESRRELIDSKYNKFAIVRLSRKLNVCPGLLVGQLQKGGYIPYNRMNSLKRRYDWVNL